ncbi:hypothetical protein KCQ61_26355, partial [Klebsiella pneumoniae]|nr:hypothetical protein [Klebsiella pneumoniae]
MMAGGFVSVGWSWYVTDISYSGNQARLKLAIDSGEMGFIPSNATVRIAGNTIFGAKSVEFIPPKTPSPKPLSPNAHVAASQVQLEVNTLFQSLIDLLYHDQYNHTNPPAI